MARFTIEIETVDASPAEWVDALVKVRGLPSFALSEEPAVVTDVEAAAAGAALEFLELAAGTSRRLGGLPLAPEQARDLAEAVKNLTCSAYSAMRLVGGAK